jgi:hypothetical protein
MAFPCSGETYNIKSHKKQAVSFVYLCNLATLGRVKHKRLLSRLAANTRKTKKGKPE